MENKRLLKVTDLAIGHEGRILCSGISFDICEGDCIMLCGANGSGKTTLMKALADKEETPCIRHESGCECIMIPARIPKVAGFTLREFVRISCFSKSDLYGKLSKEEESAMDKAIAELGLSHLADRDISTLSDGEFQKAGIASALVRKASVIMLDEPTAFLDIPTRFEVCRLLADLAHNGGKTILFSTHDLDSALPVCDSFAIIEGDQLRKLATADAAAEMDRIFKQ